MELSKVKFEDDLIEVFQKISQHLSSSIEGLQN